MAVELPTFENSYCLSLTACGRLKGKILTKRGSLDEEPKVARYRAASGTAFVRAWLTDKPAQHLHIDCALRKIFPEDKIPKVTGKKADVLEIINSVLGAQIDVSIGASFEVPRTKLAESGIIRALSVEQKTVDISVKITGCDLSLTGAPVNKIQWSTREGKNRTVVDVRMEADRSLMVSEKYLTECWDWINNQFAFFVLGKRKDE